MFEEGRNPSVFQRYIHRSGKPRKPRKTYTVQRNYYYRSVFSFSQLSSKTTCSESSCPIARADSSDSSCTVARFTDSAGDPSSTILVMSRARTFGRKIPYQQSKFTACVGVSMVARKIYIELAESITTDAAAALHVPS